MNAARTASAGDDDAIDLIALWRLMWRHRILIACVAAAFNATAVALSLLTKPVFRAESVVTQVTDSGLGGAGSSIAGRIGGLASLAGIDIGTGGAGSQDAQAVLESRGLVEEFIRRNNLVGEIMPEGGEQATLWFAVRRFKNSVLSVSKDDIDPRIVIAVEWKDPELAARWTNGLVSLANELLRERALADAQRNVEYLRKQIAATNVVEMQRVMYGLIENETKTLMLANARTQYAFNVIDAAVVPEMRDWPKRKLMVLTGGALGLTFGMLFVFFRDTVRRYHDREAARDKSAAA